jgi:uncharacterized membrane protein
LQTTLGVASWFHLVAAVVWMGGIIMLLYVVWPELGQILGLSAERSRIAHGIVRRFTPISMACIALLGITGSVMMLKDENYLGLLELRNNWSRLLLLKHVLFLVMTVAAVYIGFVLNPRIGKAFEESPRRRFQLALRQRAVARLNVILVILILLITGLLTGI